MTMSVKDLVTEARAGLRNLNVDEVASALDDGVALLVDIREPRELEEQGVIPGAIHAARGMLEFHADPSSPYHRGEFDPSRRIILYCASGGRSALAAATLTRMGYDDLAHLDGGLKAWKDAGRPVDTRATAR
jgi:rhodanese-related sulfurtransferase